MSRGVISRRPLQTQTKWDQKVHFHWARCVCAIFSVVCTLSKHGVIVCDGGLVTYARTCVCVHGCMHICVQACMRSRWCVCICVCMRACVCTGMQACARMCVGARVYVHVCMCVY